MTSVLEAASNHAPAVCELVKQMHTESKYAHIKFDPYKVQRLVNATIHNQDSVVLIAVDSDEGIAGFIALEQAQYFFNFDNYVYDMGFYVKPTFRTTTVPYRLIRAAEAWSEAHGKALVLGVTAPEDDSKVVGFYSKLGYTHWGTVMRKEI